MTQKELINQYRNKKVKEFFEIFKDKNIYEIKNILESLPCMIDIEPYFSNFAESILAINLIKN